MPVPLLILLNLTPAERLQALQQDREELFVLMGVALGLLVLAFVLLVVVIFRRQKTKKDERNEEPLPLQDSAALSGESRFAPAQASNPDHGPSNEPKTGEGHPVQETQSQPDSAEDVPAEIEIEAQPETDEFLSENTPTVGQAASEAAQQVDAAPYEEPSAAPGSESATAADQPILEEPAEQHQSESLLAEQTAEAVQEAPASLVEGTVEMEEAASNKGAETSLEPEQPEPELGEPTPQNETPEPPAEEDALLAQENPKQVEAAANPNAQRVSKQIDEALKGAKSPEENRRAIEAYLQELKQRKSGATAELEPQGSTKQTELDSSTQGGFEAEPIELPALPAQTDSEPLALLSAPHVESDVRNLEAATTTTNRADSTPEEPPLSSDFEVNWNEVQEESKSVRHLPAAPGDLKSFADWLKEFRKP